MSLLEVRDLSVRFDTEDGRVQAVDRLSLSISPGEIVAVVGESGCGKSVTAMSLLGLLPDSAGIHGTVRFDGHDLLGPGNERLRSLRGREISMIFQDPMTSLNPVITVGRQIGEVLRRHQGLGRKEARRRSIELLEAVGIPAAARRVDEYPHQLSGGMRQRSLIAMAVACDPRLLIADEPTTALDVTIQAGILDLIRELRERLGTAVLIITHDLGVVADLADRVVVMYAGRKIEEAPTHELFARPRHPYTVGLLGSIPRPRVVGGGERLREIPGVVPSMPGPASACTFAARCPRADEECRNLPPLRELAADHTVACFHPQEVPCAQT